LRSRPSLRGAGPSTLGEHDARVDSVRAECEHRDRRRVNAGIAGANTLSIGLLSWSKLLSSLGDAVSEDCVRRSIVITQIAAS